MDENEKKLREALESLRKTKPGDRSEVDRRIAVTITELEKVLAYYLAFVVHGDAGQ